MPKILNNTGKYRVLSEVNSIRQFLKIQIFTLDCDQRSSFI